jgi:hypothetical protein
MSDDNEADVPLFFRASSLDREDWDDHEYLRHMGDGLWHLYNVVKPQAKSRSSTAGTVLGIALSVMVLILMAVGGVPR